MTYHRRRAPHSSNRIRGGRTWGEFLSGKQSAESNLADQRKEYERYLKKKYTDDRESIRKD